MCIMIQCIGTTLTIHCIMIQCIGTTLTMCIVPIH